MTILRLPLIAEEMALACSLRSRGRPWQAIANYLGCAVQDARDAVWAAECLGFQMEVERMVKTCGRERVATYLAQCLAELTAQDWPCS